MKVKILHEEDGKFVHVANINLGDFQGIDEALERAWALSQNIEGSWSKGPVLVWEGQSMPNNDYDPGIEVIAPLPMHQGREYGHRSSSVGDVFEIEGRKFVAEGFGFKELQGEPA